MRQDQLLALLEAGDDQRLVGTPEDAHLDFKEQPYLLATDRGKWELAKDVAALANSGGGCIVIGVATRVPADREEEVAAEVKPFPQSMADVQQMRAPLDATAGVYPSLRNVLIRKFPRADEKALALLCVPPQ